MERLRARGASLCTVGVAGRAHRLRRRSASATPTGWSTMRCFMALAEHFAGRDWCDWDPPLARREPAALREADTAHAERIAFWKFCQWCFFRQWQRLKDYAQPARRRRSSATRRSSSRYHSAEVWARPDLFELDARRPARRWWPACRPTCSAPPASAGATRCTAGARMRRKATPGGSSASGAPSSWSTSCASITSAASPATGRSRPASPRPSTAAGCRGPARRCSRPSRKALGPLPIIAEDLGVITPDVGAAAQGVRLPGMRVLQFAFGGSTARGDPHYLPHNYEPDTVVYTGTHDNDTDARLVAAARRSTSATTCANTSPATAATIGWDLIRAACASVADTAVYPMQDVLGLDAAAPHELSRQGRGQLGLALQLVAGPTAPCVAPAPPVPVVRAAAGSERERRSRSIPLRLFPSSGRRSLVDLNDEVSHGAFEPQRTARVSG